MYIATFYRQPRIKHENPAGRRFELSECFLVRDFYGRQHNFLRTAVPDVMEMFVCMYALRHPLVLYQNDAS